MFLVIFESFIIKDEEESSILILSMLSITHRRRFSIEELFRVFDFHKKKNCYWFREIFRIKDWNAS